MIEDPVHFACVGFAVYYIAYIIRNVDGPFDVLLIMRTLVGFSYEELEDGSVVEITPDNFWGKLISCQHCLGFWISVLIFIAIGFDILGVFVACGTASALHNKIGDK